MSKMKPAQQCYWSGGADLDSKFVAGLEYGNLTQGAHETRHNFSKRSKVHL